jgi:transcriptional regulator with XRE-family HTH domain
MLSDTLTKGLTHYQIGPKVRSLRLANKLRLVQLAAHTGLSSAMLSKIERGQIFPSLPTLMRIAQVFGVGLDHFFAESDERLLAIVRKQDRFRLPNDPDLKFPAYFFESLDFCVKNRKVDTYVAEFPIAADAAPSHSHAGYELIFIIKGQLLVKFDDQEIELGEGDALCFDSSASHSYKQHGDAACTLLVVVMSSAN